MDWTAMAMLLVPIAGFGVVLSRMAARWPDDHSALVEQLESTLPQTQCGQCDYAGCRPYAQALAAGEAPPNRCVPGGTKTRDRLLQLLGLDTQVADFPAPALPAPAVAWVDEMRCVACTLCLDACPVDAIIGARGLAHTVLADECTGCALCLPVCPVDCILLEPVAATRPWQPPPSLQPEPPHHGPG